MRGLMALVLTASSLTGVGDDFCEMATTVFAATAHTSVEQAIDLLPLLIEACGEPEPEVVYLSPVWSHASGVEQWRGLVEAYFGDGTERALCLMGHESGGNPTAASATDDHGLMQVHWPIWGPVFNLSRQDLYDPETNVRLAFQIYLAQGWWAWSPYKRGLCR